VMATIDVEGSVFQGCNSAINAKGMTFGLRFVGNQCEQNLGAGGLGVIRGSLNGPVTITDNMLEGQPNPISIDIPQVTGNRTHLLVRGNYYEANSGAYVHRFRTNSSQASIEVGPNFLDAITATDYVLIEGAMGVINIQMKDRFPITFANSTCVVGLGSDIFYKNINYYQIRSASSYRGPLVIIDDYSRMYSDDATYANVEFSGATPSAVVAERSTPEGRRLCVVSTTSIGIPLSVVAGDMVAINILCRMSSDDNGAVTFQLWDSGVTAILRETGPITMGEFSSDRWVLVSQVFRVAADSASIVLRITPTSGTTQQAILGVTAKNHGQFVDGQAAALQIKPVAPAIPA